MKDYKTVMAKMPSQPEMFASVILASKGPGSALPVYTMHLRYPRIIHAELMTHRVFSRNARSSRAVPVKTMLAEVRDRPFVPWHWTRNQSGMQGVGMWDKSIVLKGAAGQFVDSDQPMSREAAWLWGRDMACDLAESFSDAEYHKQIANRLIEPYTWIDVLVTSTDWKNFLHLRDHPAAEGHIRDLACLVNDAMAVAPINTLRPGEMHLPYIVQKDRDWAAKAAKAHCTTPKTLLAMVSAARCARISYKPFDGDPTYERELDRFKMLAGSDVVHASPMEHQCEADTLSFYEVKRASENGMSPFKSGADFDHPELHGNLRGYIQFRKTIPNEAVFD
jgi:hypothetical protein